MSEFDVKDAAKGFAALEEVVKFLDAGFIGDSDCDGTVHGCAACDAVRLKLEAKRFQSLIYDIYYEEFTELGIGLTKN